MSRSCLAAAGLTGRLRRSEGGWRKGEGGRQRPGSRLPGFWIAELLHFCDTGCVKTTLTVTSRGVVTLPAKLRRALGLKADSQLIAETTPEGLLLRPAVTLPIEIYTEKRVREFDEAEADLDQFLRSRRSRKKSAR